MNSQLAIISHPEFGEVRNVIVKGEPWFAAKDVCDILGHTNPSMAIGLLDEDEADLRKVYVRSENGVMQQRDVYFINESGLYALIMRSNKPKTKQFRKWVTSEVLPSIRKFGFYVHPSATLTKRQLKQLEKIMLETVKKYTTKDDVCKTARKMGVSTRYVDRVRGGYCENRDVMMELQKRAIRNKAEWEDAYSPERMQRVLDALSGTVISVDDREPPVTGRSDRYKACEEYWEPLRYRNGTNRPLRSEQYSNTVHPSGEPTTAETGCNRQQDQASEHDPQNRMRSQIDEFPSSHGTHPHTDQIYPMSLQDRFR